jgi:Uma2 family endonuclease
MAVADRAVHSVPPLESGDRLTRAEFERRYEAMLEVKGAELIEGVVYMPSPARFMNHAQPHAQIMAWLGVYTAATPGVQIGDNATVRVDLDNEAQPDALLRLPEEAGGSSRLSEDDYLEGAPELIVEIAASSASYDLHDKLKVYRRSGVREYLVWQTYEKDLVWFYLHEGDYLCLTPDDSGVVRSRVFPGLSLEVKAMLRGDLASVLATLQEGLKTGEHAAFVEGLARGSKPRR